MKGVLSLLLIIISAKLYSQAKQSEIINIPDSPVNSFKNYCSRCHGYEGSAYGKGFGDMEDEELKRVVREMMIGPAQLKPEQIEVEAMYSYNKSLRDNKPFAIVLNSKAFLEGDGDNLQISVSPGAKINIENFSQIRIEDAEDIYKLFYNPGKIKSLEIKVTKNNTSSSFYFPEKLWSE